MNNKIKYEFSAAIWQHSAPNGWYFLSLPTATAAEIRENLQWQEEGWGRMKVTANIGNAQWETAIWFDTQHNTYLLPLKAAIRKRENLQTGARVEVTIWI